MAISSARHRWASPRGTVPPGRERLRWKYKSPAWAGRFLDDWTRLAIRPRVLPFQKLARTLRGHRELLLNWFRARSAFAHGAIDGFNNKAITTTRKEYGFRTYEHTELALYHALGNLPEPDWITHKFF